MAAQDNAAQESRRPVCNQCTLFVVNRQDKFQEKAKIFGSGKNGVKTIRTRLTPYFTDSDFSKFFILLFLITT